MSDLDHVSIHPLVQALRVWLTVEGGAEVPPVPVCCDSAGNLDVAKTLALSVYDSYPDKAMWS